MTDDPGITCAHDRLILDSKLTSLLGLTEGDPQIHVRLGEVFGMQVDDLIVGAALSLHLVHGQVGGVDQLFRVVMGLTGKGNTDTGGDLDVSISEFEWGTQDVDDSGRDDFDLFHLVELLAEDDELVSRQAGDGVGRSKGSSDAFGRSNKEIVAHLVPVGIIHRFEMIEVDEQDRHEFLRTAAAHDGMLDALEQKDPVGKAGQHIVDGSLVRAVGRFLQIGPRLGIDEIGGRHVGQRLGRAGLRWAQVAGRVTVEIEGTEAVPSVT